MKDFDVVVGVDIGSSKVSTVIAQVTEEAVNVLGVSDIAAKGIRKGQIVDIEEAASVLNASLNTAERMAGYSIDRVFCSISGINIEGQNSKGIVAVSEPHGEITSQDVERVLEAAGAISLPSSRSILHIVPRSFTVDGEDGIKDPVGMTGIRLEVDTHIITANSTTIKNVTKVLESEVGVNLNDLVFSGLASSCAVLTETEKELGVVMLDIGGGITNMCVYVEGALSYSCVIPIGAKHITNDLAIGLRISLESAEKIKLYLSSQDKKKEETEKIEGNKDEIDLFSLGLAENIKKVSRKTLVDGIIKPRLNEIFTMVALELKKSGLATQAPAGVVVTGGGAKTIGVQEAARRMLAMSVRVGIPFGVTGLIDDVEDCAFATAVGLIMYAKKSGKVAARNFMSGALSSLNFSFLLGLVGKIKKLFKNFLP